MTSLLLPFLIHSQAAGGSQLQQTPDPNAPVFEVRIDTSVKGRLEISSSKASSLLLNALETAGIEKGVRFASRAYTTARGEVERNDRSGDFETVDGGQRGRFVRASHRADLAYVLERNVSSKKLSKTTSRVSRDSEGRWQDYLAGSTRVTEKVFLTLRTAIFDTTTNASSGAIPRIKAEAVRTLYHREGEELYHHDRIRIWIFDVPVKVTDYEVDSREVNLPRGLELTDEVLEKVASEFATRLAALPRTTGATPQRPNLDVLRVESVGSDNRTVSFAGKISGLKVSQLLVVPITPRRREPVAGEGAHVYVKVTRIGRESALGVIVDLDGKRSRIPSGMVVDARRPIRRF